eukprot:m.46003 g.46003  ORF g.46003 m.46003 type:complete len:364 (+) comp15321_c0_seq1:310-1401(+)
MGASRGSPACDPANDGEVVRTPEWPTRCAPLPLNLSTGLTAARDLHPHSVVHAESRVANVSYSTEETRGHSGGWGKALVIGVFAGVPTAVFHQLSFLQTLKKRGEPIRGWIPGATPSLRNMLRCRVPGLLPAIARDVCYLAATQKQVQNASPALSEAALCWFLVVAAPIFFDTLSVKAVTPGYNRPKLTSLKGCSKFLRYGCPPEALLGRLVWVPFYNLAYVTVQQQIGDADRKHETAGLIIGSLAASLVAYPAFMFKTALLLDQVDQDRAPKGSRIPDSHFNRLRGSLVRSFGFKSKAEIWYTLRQKGGLVTVLRRGFSGVGAHTVGNIGPDVFCMGFGRAAYMLLLVNGLAPSPHTNLLWE